MFWIRSYSVESTPSRRKRFDRCFPFFRFAIPGINHYKVRCIYHLFFFLLRNSGTATTTILDVIAFEFFLGKNREITTGTTAPIVLAAEFILAPGRFQNGNLSKLLVQNPVLLPIEDFNQQSTLIYFYFNRQTPAIISSFFTKEEPFVAKQKALLSFHPKTYTWIMATFSISMSEWSSTTISDTGIESSVTSTATTS